LKIRPYVPDGDVVIATWWRTAKIVYGLPERKGAKAYFIQHHEVHEYLPADEARASYRLPLHKIVVAQWLKDVMQHEYDSDSVVIPNSVEHDRFFASPRGKQNVPTVGLLYASIPWKGFSVAMAALQLIRKRALPNLRVHCFGIEQLNPIADFVSFTLRPPQDRIRHIYASCDVWLTASHSEGFNLPAMEAMACRTPVVATRTGWPAEAIVDGWNGACVDVGDVEALATETERILQLPDERWRLMSDRAYETVRNASWKSSADQFEAQLIRLAAIKDAAGASVSSVSRDC